MARSWSGFAAQNQSVKEQWGLLEATQVEISDLINLAPPVIETGESPEQADEEIAELANFFRAHRLG
jgi:hypothetical protein